MTKIRDSQLVFNSRDDIPGILDANHAYELKVINKKPWFTPAIVLASVARIEQKFGSEDLEKSGNFKLVREMRAVSRFLLGVIKATGIQFMLQPVLNENTPDVRTFHYAKNKEGVLEQVIQEVEVVTYNKYSEEDLIDFIKSKKMTKTAYPDYFTVLCELNKNFSLPSPKRIKSELEKAGCNFAVSLIGKIDERKDIYRSIKVFPTIDIFEDFNLQQSVLELDQKIKSEGRHHTIKLAFKPKTSELQLETTKDRYHPFQDILPEKYWI